MALITSYWRRIAFLFILLHFILSLLLILGASLLSNERLFYSLFIVSFLHFLSAAMGPFQLNRSFVKIYAIASEVLFHLSLCYLVLLFTLIYKINWSIHIFIALALIQIFRAFARPGYLLRISAFIYGLVSFTAAFAIVLDEKSIWVSAILSIMLITTVTGVLQGISNLRFENLKDKIRLTHMESSFKSQVISSHILNHDINNLLNQLRLINYQLKSKNSDYYPKYDKVTSELQKKIQLLSESNSWIELLPLLEKIKNRYKNIDIMLSKMDLEIFIAYNLLTSIFINLINNSIEASSVSGHQRKLLIQIKQVEKNTIVYTDNVGGFNYLGKGKSSKKNGQGKFLHILMNMNEVKLEIIPQKNSTDFLLNFVNTR